MRMEKHGGDPVRFRPKYYLGTDPQVIIYLIALTLFVEGIVFLGSMYFYKRPTLSGPMAMVAVMIAFMIALVILYLLSFVRLDEDGITHYSIFRRKKRILWKNICCSGDFYHFVIMSGRFKRQRFFYFSTKPIPGGVDYSREMSLPNVTNTFVFVPDQRDVESLIMRFVPRKKFCLSVPPSNIRLH